MLAFLILVIIGGSNAVAVRFSNLELPPFWGAALRFIVAALIYWGILLIKRVPLPAGRALVGNVIYGILTIGLSYAFLYWGLQKITASMTMIVMATGPLLTMLFASAHRLERLEWRGLLGAVVALGGILLAASQNLGASAPVASLLAVLMGTACIAEGTVLFKLFPKSDPLATNTISATTGASLLVLVSLLAGESWSLPGDPTALAAVAYLAIVGSVLLFYLVLFVLIRWTASATSYAFLLFPVATVSIAAWLSGETISPWFIAGGAIVLLGVWLGAIRQTRQPSTHPEQSKEPGAEPCLPPQPGCA